MEAVIERVLREWIDLAKPDDLSFLEMQVPTIVNQIMRELAAQK